MLRISLPNGRKTILLSLNPICYAIPRHPLPPFTTRARVFGTEKEKHNNLATFTSFPTKLFHYSPAEKTDLLDVKTGYGILDKYFEYHVSITGGLVYSRVDELTHSNGPVFMPNTTFMQEYTRVAYDNYLMDQASGQKLTEPFIFCIARGTLVPHKLLLLNERDSRFTLRPDRPLQLKDFNHLLDEFYNQNATKAPVGQWLAENDWADAYDDNDRDGWMNA